MATTLFIWIMKLVVGDTIETAASSVANNVSGAYNYFAETPDRIRESRKTRDFNEKHKEAHENTKIICNKYGIKPNTDI